MPVELKAPKTSLKDKNKDPKGKKPRARNVPRRKHTSSLTKHNPRSKIDANKSGSYSKEPTGSKTSHSHKETKSSSALDSNPSQPSASTPVVAEMHKEDQQATGGPTSLEVTNEGGANPQLNSDYPIIVVDESEVEEESKETHATKHTNTEDTLAPQPSSPSSLLTKLKELPSKFNELTGEVKELKKHVHDLEIELPWDLKEIPKKLESPKSFSQPEREHIKKDNGKRATSSKDAKEEGSKSDSDDIIHLIGSMVESLKKKLKDFDFVTKGGDHVHLTEEQIKAQKIIEESAKAEAAKHEVEVRKEEPIDLLSPDVVSKYYKAKLQYEKYYYKMLNRRASSKNKNYDVLTRKVPITLKVYREDGTSKVIPNFKASDLHLAGTVLNEPVLGMIMFNSYHRQNFFTIKDFRDFLNEMLYTVQEIFFRLHQGPGLDDHAKTFSSFLLAEVDKRNLNPLKQMRTIKQLR
nr:hypothetical protein [Tanacetum cinerariifolium]